MASLACALLAILIALPIIGEARTNRSASQVSAFKRQNTCPSTGQRGGKCPGYVVDHLMPLCAGGEDNVSNMQWQEYRESLLKDAHERRLCRAMRRQAIQFDSTQ